MPSIRGFAGLVSIGARLAAQPSVQIHDGTLRGTTCEDATTHAYRGIPYAEPPVGSLRFMPPQPPNGSFPNGILDASQFSATCIQMLGEFSWGQPSESEDCLYLNVYVPPGNVSGLPVKVWAHGGGNIGGSTSYPLYDLCHLATDSIAVSFNYRLGPLGFLGLKDAGIEGNMAIKDYVAVLTWVQKNIAAFGGDPGKVMLFGQSSGADDSFVVSTLPQARALMRSATCESGGGVDLPPFKTVQSVGADYAATLACSSSDIACLQSKSTQELVEAYITTSSLYEGVGTFSDPALGSWSIALPNTTTLSSAFVDGSFITRQPLAAGPQVPILLGSNVNDASLFALPPLFLSGGPISEENYTTFLSQFGPAAAAIKAQYPLSAFNASGSTETAVEAAITHVQTVAGYTCFTERGLRSALRSGVHTYAYQFNDTMSCPWLWIDGATFPYNGSFSYFGTAHTAEIPLVLGNLHNLPWGNGTCNVNEVEKAVSAGLKDAWTAMAKSGDPSTKSLDWPEFQLSSAKGVRVENANTAGQLDFSECEFWDEVWRKMGGVDICLSEPSA